MTDTQAPASKATWRSNIILFCSLAGLLACVAAVTLAHPDDSTRNFISNIGMGLLSILIGAANYEFGSSRSSQNKTDQMASLMNVVATQTIPLQALPQTSASKPQLIPEEVGLTTKVVS